MGCYESTNYYRKIIKTTEVWEIHSQEEPKEM